MKMKITMGNRGWRGKRAILGNISCNWGNFDKLDIVEFPYILPTSNRSGKSAFYRTTLPFLAHRNDGELPSSGRCSQEMSSVLPLVSD